jgi:hypothetical protein
MQNAKCKMRCSDGNGNQADDGVARIRAGTVVSAGTLVGDRMLVGLV